MATFQRGDNVQITFPTGSQQVGRVINVPGDSHRRYAADPSSREIMADDHYRCFYIVRGLKYYVTIPSDRLAIV